ncbi:hypothetical protein J6590_092465 [Homalodisca vitripennis]|nr:hypothetical protein J6590_092465 [Homalodisca vitripennis]
MGHQFPMLLRTVLEDLNATTEINIKAGFKKAGIFPSNKEEILARLPQRDRSLNLTVNASDLEPPTSTDVEQASTSRKATIRNSMAKKKEPPAKKGKPDPSDSTSEDEDAFSIQDSGESDLVLSRPPRMKCSNH